MQADLVKSVKFVPSTRPQRSVKLRRVRIVPIKRRHREGVGEAQRSSSAISEPHASGGCNLADRRDASNRSAEQDGQRFVAADARGCLQKHHIRPAVYTRTRRATELGLWAGLVGLAIISRYTLLDVESRTQILCLWLIAATVEWPVKIALGLRSRSSSFLSVCVMIAIAVITTRGFIEGLCPHTWPNCNYHEPTKIIQAILAS